MLASCLPILDNPSYGNSHNSNIKSVYEHLRNKQFSEAINKLNNLSKKK